MCVCVCNFKPRCNDGKYVVTGQAGPLQRLMVMLLIYTKLIQAIIRVHAYQLATLYTTLHHGYTFMELIKRHHKVQKPIQLG